VSGEDYGKKTTPRNTINSERTTSMPIRFINRLRFDFGETEGFKPAIHEAGFDPAERFQMLGVDDLRYFSMTGGNPAGMSVDVTPAAICRFEDPPDLSSTIFTGILGQIGIRAVAEGDAALVLTDSMGKTVDKIDIKVVKPRNVKVRFYNLRDSLGRQAVDNPDINPLFNVLALDQLIFAVNTIVNDQCAVKLAKLGQGLLRDLTFQKDLTNRVNIFTTNQFESTDLDTDADYHVAFTWGIDSAHTNGITRTNFSLLQVSLSEIKRKLTAAHELVHFLSMPIGDTTTDHDDQKADLMFKTSPHGIMMRKARLIRIIH